MVLNAPPSCSEVDLSWGTLNNTTLLGHKILFLLLCLGRNCLWCVESLSLCLQQSTTRSCTHNFGRRMFQNIFGMFSNSVIPVLYTVYCRIVFSMQGTALFMRECVALQPFSLVEQSEAEWCSFCWCTRSKITFLLASFLHKTYKIFCFLTEVQTCVLPARKTSTVWSCILLLAKHQWWSCLCVSTILCFCWNISRLFQFLELEWISLILARVCLRNICIYPFHRAIFYFQFSCLQWPSLLPMLVWKTFSPLFKTNLKAPFSPFVPNASSQHLLEFLAGQNVTKSLGLSSP